MKLTDVKISANGYTAEFSSRRGATCYRLTNEPLSCDVLRTPKSEEDLKINPYLYGNPILFPCNRIRGGKFTFDGREYSFPINEQKTNCHIHGALYALPFKITEIAQDKVSFYYEAKEGEYIGFPHAFSVERKYSLSDGGLEEQTTFANLSDKIMPLMLAFHTTFNAPFCGNGECLATIPVACEQLRDENFLPTGEFSDGGEREQNLRRGSYEIGKTHLSALYKVNGTECELTANGVILKYTASPEYGYRMTYAEKGAGFMVIEPQTSAIDCFHLASAPEENGLISLGAGEKITLFTRVAVAEK